MVVASPISEWAKAFLKKALTDRTLRANSLSRFEFPGTMESLLRAVDHRKGIGLLLPLALDHTTLLMWLCLGAIPLAKK